MATKWTFERRRLTKAGPELLFRLNGAIVFTKNYVKHTLFSKKTYVQGTEGIITRVYHGLFGGVTHVDLRLPSGEFLCAVPVENFLTDCEC